MVFAHHDVGGDRVCRPYNPPVCRGRLSDRLGVVSKAAHRVAHRVAMSGAVQGSRRFGTVAAAKRIDHGSGLIVNSKKPRRRKKKGWCLSNEKISNTVNLDICLSVSCRDGFLHRTGGMK